jgi:hypothetical protein
MGGEEDAVKRRSGFGRKSVFVVLLGVLAALAVILVPAGSATPGGTYTANLCDFSQLVDNVCPEGVSGAALPGGSTSLYLTLHKTSGSLGSANIGLPAGPATLFEYTGAQIIRGAATPNHTATQVTLRNINLAPGNLVTVKLTLTACTSGTYDWSGTGVIDVKDDGGFNDTSLVRNPPSSLAATLDAANQCHLAVVSGHQPQDTLKNQTITDDLYSNGGPIQVGLYAPSNNLVTIDGSVLASVSGGAPSPTLGGDTTQDLVSGVASFGDLSLNKTNGSPGEPDYTLGFALTGATSATSDGFSIVDAGKKCPGGNCSLSADFGATGGNSTTTSNVSTSFTTAGGLSLAFFTSALPADVTGPAGGCKGFVPTTSAGVTYEVHGTIGTAFITYGLSDKALKDRFGPNYGQKNVPLCVGAQRVTEGGVPIPCNTDTGKPWTGKELDAKGLVASGKFRAAVCDPTTHKWWGIAPNFQDTLPKNTTLEPISIVISSWGSGTALDGTILRLFMIAKPPPWDGNMHG